ncbi:MAG: hypothetical protein D6729_04530 [Deltaproteobacteria bacterium]|nr:MAG: hypothetical protein D6729_04530 [Deltaproteobacteria bacterium]
MRPCEEVVATVPFDLIMNFGVGLATAWAAREEIRLGPRGQRRPLFALLAFEALVFCPLGAYLYAVHTDWSWNYFLDPDTLPAWFGVVAIAGYAAAAVAGYLLGVHLLRRGQTRRVLHLCLGITGLLAIYFAVFFRRFWWVGRYQDYAVAPGRPAMQPFLESRLGWVLLVAGTLLVGALGWMLVHLERHGRRLRAHREAEVGP